MGAYIPGVIIAASLVAYVSFVARRRGLSARGSASWPVLAKKLRVSIWALSMPLLLIVGAKGGLFTVTELGAILVFYALFVGWIIHREFSWRQFPAMASGRGSTNSKYNANCGRELLLAYLIVIHGIPRDIQSFIHNSNIGRFEFLLMVNCIFLIAGIFLDSTPATIILVPIFLPAALALGIDPTHFGLVVVLNLMIGLIHPPIGLNLLITQSISKAKMRLVVWKSLPIMAIILVVLGIITYVPQTVLWVPEIFVK